MICNNSWILLAKSSPNIEAKSASETSSNNSLKVSNKSLACSRPSELLSIMSAKDEVKMCPSSNSIALASLNNSTSVLFSSISFW